MILRSKSHNIYFRWQNLPYLEKLLTFKSDFVDKIYVIQRSNKIIKLKYIE